MGQGVCERKVSLMYALAFLVVLGIVVLVHEYGHFAAARACGGVKVYEFAIGFGPPQLFSWKRGGRRSMPCEPSTRGGMCRLAGMDDSDLPEEQMEEDDPGASSTALYGRECS